MADMTKLQEAGRLPDADGTLTAGTCDAILKVPPGWDEIATANWRTLQQDRAARLGEMLAEQKATEGLAKGGAEKGVGRRGNNALPEGKGIPTLASAGISHKLSASAQNLAKLSSTWKRCRGGGHFGSPDRK